MKLTLKMLYLASLLFCSCVAKKEKAIRPEKVDTMANSESKDTAGGILDTICDYYVDSVEADSMIKKYLSDFHKTSLKKEVWIEKCVLLSIKSFLDANQNYDGVRFFWGVEKVFLGKNTMLLIVPTMPANSGQKYERHSNQYGVSIPLDGCAPRYVKINMPTTDALNRVNEFGQEFRKENIEGQRGSAAIKPLSISVWISKCKIDALHSLFISPGNNLDGLMAIAASYYKDDVRRTNKGDREFVVQSTLIFVPTQNRKADWNVVKPPPAWKDTGGLNHGELCPKICD